MVCIGPTFSLTCKRIVCYYPQRNLFVESNSFIPGCILTVLANSKSEMNNNVRYQAAHSSVHNWNFPQHLDNILYDIILSVQHNTYDSSDRYHHTNGIFQLNSQHQRWNFFGTSEARRTPVVEVQMEVWRITNRWNLHGSVWHQQQSCAVFVKAVHF